MERLTEKRDGQNVIPLRQNGKIKWAICSAGLGDAPTEYLYGDHADRLAAYEDTGLEPEEIELLEKQRDLYVDACGELPLKRIRELAQADREGRCVVLPIGGYSDKDGEKALKNAMFVCSLTNNAVNRYTADAIAEKLTRAEAEAALRREQDG